MVWKAKEQRVCTKISHYTQGTQVNYLPGNRFREDSQPISGVQVLRGSSTQVVQSLKQIDCDQWFGRLRSNEFGPGFRTTHCIQLHNNQPFMDMGEPRASQCLAHLDYIQVGERRQELVLVWDLAA